MLAYSTKFAPISNKDKYEALYSDYIGTQAIDVFGLFMSFGLNFCLVLDLIIMIKYPFSDKNKFMVRYLTFVPLTALIFSIGLTT